MNLKEVKEMINLMNENSLSEIEIERDGLKIRLKKSQGQGHEVFMEKMPVMSAQQQLIMEKTSGSAKETAEKKLIEIKAPLVGTFYRAPSPEAESFVEIGQDIEIGQVICIVEAMKLMNEIKSEVRGKVVDILAENADPVEYGQILFLIEPN
ncbi:MAG: acetyl-CoA carboxylase biotin carboxyl carrier protein [Candidatus Omnitrophica bacterium]|nr:acetyl-CoA carboxylase biotin carboxyl carrier protein [Candidatus Omnitrophota bacterium]